MNVIYSVKDYVTNVFDFQQANVSGAIDIVAVEHESGAVKCTPFHVHFGRGGELTSQADKTVTLVVNGEVVPDVHMKLGAAGEAFFVDAVESPVDDDYRTSPLASPSAAAAPSPSSSTTTDTKDSVTSHMATFETAQNDHTEHHEMSEPAEWHDAYRLVSEPRLSSHEANASSERLTWGWGALPIVRTSSGGDLLAEETQAQAVDGETTAITKSMVKSESVYFDAVEAENLQSLQTLQGGPYVSDHPCMSLCGHLLSEAQTREQAHAIFSDHIITFESFKADASSILQNPDLRFLVDGKICPFNSDIQAYLVSRVLFPSSQPLPLTCAWTQQSVPRGSRRVSERRESAAFWFGDVEEEDEGDDDEEDEGSFYPGQSNGSSDGGEDAQSRRWFHWFPRSASIGSESGKNAKGPAFQPVVVPPSVDSPSLYFRKTLLPSQEQLAHMGLRHGTNDIEFVVATSTGSERVCAKLYLWPVSAKIIIAEIDGAISRVAPTSSGRRLSSLLTNKDKGSADPHQGALAFYARAARNGYRIVYLTSRGLSQADLIHAKLQRGSLENRDLSLPNGPVLLSPDRLLASDNEDPLTSVTRDFKFAALNGIRTLFPQDVNPFYAAFGNTYADSVVFTQVGVFPGKVFLVDQGDGRLRHRSMMNYQESYSSLLGLLDKMFPPICSSPSLRHPPTSSSSRRHDSTEKDASLSPSLTAKSSSSSLPSSPRSLARSLSPPPGSMKRVCTVTEEFVTDVLSSHVRTRSMGDEAFNDVNFWRIQPGSV